MSGEFAFLERLRQALPELPPGQVGVGDDTAVLGGGLLFCTDVLTEGIHFDLRWSTPADVGWKALAVNLSDIAAMGGTPRAAVCGVVLGAGRKGEADNLAAGLMAAAAELGCPLVGGDTVVGAALTVTVAVVGDSPEGGAVLRSGARPGDSVFVSGPLGGSRAALAALRRGEAADPVALARLQRPAPRVMEGQTAAGAGAGAMIDLSDGLSSDLAHLCRASGVGARLEASAIPVGPGAAVDDALSGGDDYELCFTAADPGRVAEAFAAAGLHLPAPIGTITAGDEVLLATPNGGTWPLAPGGWEHPVE
ncbi:MAG TPA: thiamine-phosphate kinase [Acidimicrobiia bacterium]|nr:thiamine-phosphate kinase [Acidimicrobiia bacterium]